MEYSIQHTFNTYYDLYVPGGADKPRPLIIATHGYSGNKKSMLRLAKKVNDTDYVIASLQGPHQHFRKLGDPRDIKQDIGFGWLTPWKPEEAKDLHHNSITAIIDKFTTDGVVDPKRVFLLGFSQSVSLNLRYAMTFPERIRGLVSICGGIPFDLLENDLYRPESLEALYIHMDRDEFYPPEKAESNAATLRSVARSVDVVMLEGLHTISPAMFPIINDWLAARI